MKKHIVFCCLAMLLLLVAGCNKKDSESGDRSGQDPLKEVIEPSGDTTPDLSEDGQGAIPTGSPEILTDVEFEVQYIRTNGYHEDVSYPSYSVVESVEQLSAYYEEFKGKYDLERKENPLSDMTIGFLDACDAYDEAFFEEKALVLVLLEEGSGSVRHKVTAVETVNSRLLISIESIVPEVGTDDMAEWHIIVAVDKEALPTLGEDIEIRYNR